MKNKSYYRISYDEWLNNYSPIKNHIDDTACFDGIKFETYGTELKIVRSEDASKIWTLVDEDGRQMIVSGYVHVNRLGHFITHQPWNENIVIEID